MSLPTRPFVFEVWGEYTSGQRCVNLRRCPEAYCINLSCGKGEKTIKMGGKRDNILCLEVAAHLISMEEGEGAIGNTEFFEHLSGCRRSVGLARIKVTADTGIPFPRLHIFAHRPLLQKQPPLAIKDEDMGDAMNQLRIAVALGAQGQTDDLIVRIDNLQIFAHNQLLRPDLQARTP